MFKYKTIWCSLVILFFINSAYAAETKVLCPTNVVCKKNQCNQTILVSPWVKLYPASDPLPDGTYHFIRADVYKEASDNEYHTSCWLEDPNGSSILIYSMYNNVYPGKGGHWSQFACTDFSENNPKNCPLIWKHD